jgi:uncharacterized membrane protein
MTRAIFLSVLFSAISFAGADEAYFTGIGVLNPDQPALNTSSNASAISGDGTVVVGLSTVGESDLALIRWTLDGGLEEMPDFLRPLDISGDGSIIVGHDELNQAVRWCEDTGLTYLFDSFKAETSYPWAISDDGTTIVGGFWNQDQDGTDIAEAFVLTEEIGEIEQIGDFDGGAFLSTAGSVSADGQLAVGIGTSVDGYEAFLWNGVDGLVGLGDLPGGDQRSLAFAISADGSTVAGWSSSAASISLPVVYYDEAFRWTEETGMVGLGHAPDGSLAVEARDISDDGGIIVGRLFQNRPFVWDEASGVQSLEPLLARFGIDVSGWVLRSVSAVSGDGLTLVGTGKGPCGQEGWVAHLPFIPRPGDFDLDDDVDLTDFAEFVICFGQTSITTSCLAADGDDDGDVDLLDFGVFQLAYTGSL